MAKAYFTDIRGAIESIDDNDDRVLLGTVAEDLFTGRFLEFDTVIERDAVLFLTDEGDSYSPVIPASVFDQVPDYFEFVSTPVDQYIGFIAVGAFAGKGPRRRMRPS
jgi:hypothetical protein